MYLMEEIRNEIGFITIYLIQSLKSLRSAIHIMQSIGDMCCNSKWNISHYVRCTGHIMDDKFIRFQRNLRIYFTHEMNQRKYQKMFPFRNYWKKYFWFLILQYLLTAVRDNMSPLLKIKQSGENKFHFFNYITQVFIRK